MFLQGCVHMFLQGYVHISFDRAVYTLTFDKAV